MFEYIRTHQRLMQFLLLVFIVPSFALIGMGGYTTYVSGDHDLVKVGKMAITQEDFDQARRNQLQQMQQSNPGGFDPAMLDTEAARSALLESLIDRTVLIVTARNEHFSVSDAVLRQSIASTPQLQVNGQFSPDRYNQLLSANGLTSQEFEQGRRSDLALNRVLGPVAATASVPAPVAGTIERTLTEQRTVQLSTYPASAYIDSINVSDDQIKAWYDKNKKQLELPTQVSADYLLLNEAAAMKDVPTPNEQQMRTYYEQNKARYVVSARVNLSHILVSVPVGATSEERKQALAKAQKIAKEAKVDKSRFADIARAQSQDAGTAKDGGKLGWITKGSWPPTLEKAVFAMKQGEVSGPVDGPGGYHIFMANEVQPEKGQSFEQAKAQVEGEIRRQLGADRFADMATKLTGLVYDTPDSLQPAADELGLKVKSANGIARDQLLDVDQVLQDAASASPDAQVLADARVRRALFSPQVLTEKHNSGVIEISPNTMVVVRVNSVTPAHIPKPERVIAHIREVLVAQGAQAAAQAAGQKDLAVYQKLDDATVPDSFGGAMTVSRMDPNGINKQVLAAVFNAPTKELPEYTGIAVPAGYAVARISNARPGITDDPSLAGLSTELGQAWGRAEEQAVLQALRVQAEVKVLPEASQAISTQGQAS